MRFTVPPATLGKHSGKWWRHCGWCWNFFVVGDGKDWYCSAACQAADAAYVPKKKPHRSYITKGATS